MKTKPILGYDLMDTILPILGIDPNGKGITKVVLTMNGKVATVDVTRLVDFTKPELETKHFHVIEIPKVEPVIQGRDLQHIHTEIIKKGL